MNHDVLSLWTVYDHPDDYPHGFIARRHVAAAGMHGPTSDILTAPTLDALRALLPPDLYRLPRAACDDLAIVETWI